MTHSSDPQHDPMVIRLKTKPTTVYKEEAPVVREDVKAVRAARKEFSRDVQSALWVSGLGVLVVALFFLFMWSMRNAREITATHSGTTTASSATPLSSESDILARIGKLILLPASEVPVIATVSNLDALKGQSFFKNAKLGDIVLMYKGAARAILYDPTSNKIIELAPITGDTVQQ